MGYYDLAREARLTLSSLKKMASMNRGGEEDTDVITELAEEIALWEQRLSELGIRVASALVEMEDLDGATRFLSTLKPPSFASTPSRVHLETQKALLWLHLGDVETARSGISLSSYPSKNHEGKVILALAHMADSNFESAVGVWEDLLSVPPEVEDGQRAEEAMYKTNLAVSFLYLGRMDEVCFPFLRSFISFFPSHLLLSEHSAFTKYHT